MSVAVEKPVVVDGVPRRIGGCRECGLCLCGQREKRSSGQASEIERIALEVVRRLSAEVPHAGVSVPVGVSVRHVHLSREALDSLYGSGYQPKKLRDLYQPGHYATNETVTIVGPKMRVIERVRILAPLRDYSQVELSRTDGIMLGLELPVRDSGNLDGAPPITIVGPAGSVRLEHGAIRATRHIHMSSGDAVRLGIEGERTLRVSVGGDRALTFEGVALKLSDDCIPELHLDTDDANAAGLLCGDRVTVLRSKA